ncbi:hypothetical protein ColLi_10922 [Colletotrichum liriopes]|uniref:Uncharacterized protein n=1 Tax=Colletotrichum liriopes TaxID=708192 RepID=A0AA37GWE6_9PEZI|nr:hypothetical protein ColLi_10922 [Colletotrichum liriopes]
MATADERSRSQSEPAQTNLAKLRDAVAIEPRQQILHSIEEQDTYKFHAAYQKEQAPDRETVLGQEYEDTSNACNRASKDQAGNLDDSQAWVQSAIKTTNAAFKTKRDTIEHDILETNRKRQLADRGLEADSAKRARLDKVDQLDTLMTCSWAAVLGIVSLNRKALVP